MNKFLPNLFEFKNRLPAIVLVAFILFGHSANAQCPNPLGNTLGTSACSGVPFSLDNIQFPYPPDANITWGIPTGTGFTGGEANTDPSTTGFFGTLTNSTSSLQTATYTLMVDGCDDLTFNVLIYPNPSPPAVTAGSRCGAGPVSLSASSTVQGNFNVEGTFNWYTSASGGSPVQTSANNLTSNSFTTPSISASTTYYVSFTTAANGCESTRTPVTASVRAIPTLSSITVPQICNGSQPTITLNGLITSTASFIVTYTIGGGSPLTQNIAYSGNSTSFTAPTSLTSNSAVAIQSIAYSSSPNCSTPFTTSAPITVRPLLTLSSTAASPVCAGQTSNITLSGLRPSTPLTVEYSIQGAAPVSVNFTSNSSGTGSFSTPAIAGTPLNQTVVINSVSYSSAPQCPLTNFASGSNSATITVSPASVINSIIDESVCQGTTSLSWSVNGSNLSNNVTYSINWGSDNIALGLPQTSTGNLSSTSSSSGTISISIGSSVAPGSYSGTITISNPQSGCPGAVTNNQSIELEIKPIPVLQLASGATVCSNETVSATPINVLPAGISGTVTGSWSYNGSAIGLNPASGAISSLPFSIPAFSSSGDGSGNITAQITVNGCSSGASPVQIRSIQVKPRPVISVSPSNGFSFCDSNSDLNNSPTAIQVSSNLANTTFQWSNTNPSIGLAASGSGSSIPLSAWNSNVNVNQTPQTASLIFNATADGCASNPISNYSITVNPTPQPVAITENPICHNATLSPIQLTATPSGQNSFEWNFNWSPTNPPASYPVSGQTSIIPTATYPNLTNNNFVGTLTARVTSSNGCRTSSFAPAGQLTVQPNPTISLFPENFGNICNGNDVNIQVNSAISGIEYQWNYPISAPPIGLLTNSGSNSPPAFTAANSSDENVTGIITFTPTLGSCPPGASIAYPITVTPGPRFETILSGTTLTTDTPIQVCSEVPLGQIQLDEIVGSVTVDSLYWEFESGGDLVAYTYNGNLITGDNPVSGNSQSITGLTMFNLSENQNPVQVQGIFKAISLSSSCQSENVFNFVVNPKPRIVGNFSDIDSICDGREVEILLQSSIADAGNTFIWQNSNPNIGLSQASGISQAIQFQALNPNQNIILSDFTASTTSARGCVSEDTTFTISVFRTPPPPTLIDDLILCSGSNYNTIEVTGTSPGISYEWIFSAGLEGSFGDDVNSPSNNFNVLPNTNGSIQTISVKSQNVAGCQSNETTVNITVSPTVNPIDLSVARTLDGEGFIALSNQTVDQYIWGRDKCVDLSSETFPGCDNLQLCFPASGVNLSEYGYWVEITVSGCRQKQYFYGGEPNCISDLIIDQPPVSIDEFTAKNNIKVFPNPSYSGIFTINSGDFNIKEMKVTDGQGRIVEVGVLKVLNDWQIDLSQAANGVYFLYLRDELERLTTFRIVNFKN